MPNRRTYPHATIERVYLPGELAIRSEAHCGLWHFRNTPTRRVPVVVPEIDERFVRVGDRALRRLNSRSSGPFGSSETRRIGSMAQSGQGLSPLAL